MEVQRLLDEKLKTPQKVLITAHQKPDGDALGSTLGLMLFLKSKNHQVDVIYPTDYPDYYHWMPALSETQVWSGSNVQKKTIQEADIIFCLDFNSIDRIMEMKEQVLPSKALKVMIDHHLRPEDFCDITYSDATYCSTAEMIYDFISMYGSTEDITYNIALNLYAGIVTDTGGFQFSSTRSSTLLKASYLLDKGIDPGFVFNACYNNFSLDRLKLFGFCTSEKMKILNGNVAYITVSKKEKEKFNIQEGDTEGLVNFPLKVEGIEVSALFKEDGDRVKISFRSKTTFDVSELSRNHYKGGGHKNASGGIFCGKLEDATKLFESLFNS